MEEPSRQPVSDDDLHHDANRRDHERKQNILDALTFVARTAIYVVPSALAFLYILVLIHQALIGQWDALETTIRSMIIPVMTYLVGVLSQAGLIPNRNGN